MLLDLIRKGVTDKSVRVRIIDSTDGTPETGVVFNTAGIDLWYRRELEAKTSITEATLAALTTAHSDGGFLHIGDGYYRLDLPDAAFASGANYVEIGGTVTGMVVIGGMVKLIDSDVYGDTVRGGFTALPNAVAGGAAGLPIVGTGANNFKSDASANVTFANTVIATVTTLTNLPAITANWLTAAGIAAGALNGKGDWNIGKTGYALSAAGVQAIWDALTAALTTANSIGKLLVDNVNATISSRASQTSVDTIDDFLDTEIAAILEDTGTTIDDLVDDLEGRLTSALATALQAHGLGIGRGVMAAGSTTTALVFNTVNGAAASAVDDFYNGRHIVFTSGALTLQATSISDYTGATKTATVPALTGAPADTVTFIIV